METIIFFAVVSQRYLGMTAAMTQILSPRLVKFIPTFFESAQILVNLYIFKLTMSR